MNKISKISLRLLWGVIAGALPQILKGDKTTPLESEGIDLGAKLGNQVVDALTDNNPDDKAQINKIIADNKEAIADFSLDIVQEAVIDKIKSDEVKLVASVALETLRTILQKEWQDNEDGKLALVNIGENANAKANELL